MIYIVEVKLLLWDLPCASHFTVINLPTLTRASLSKTYSNFNRWYWSYPMNAKRYLKYINIHRPAKVFPLERNIIIKKINTSYHKDSEQISLTVNSYHPYTCLGRNQKNQQTKKTGVWIIGRKSKMKAVVGVSDCWSQYYISKIITVYK